MFHRSSQPSCRSRFPSSPRQHEAGEGRLWDDLLLAVDLDHRPIGVHGDDPAAGEAPEQTGAVEVIEGPCWMTSKQARGVPAEVGRSFGPGRLDEPAMRWHSGMRW